MFAVFVVIVWVAPVESLTMIGLEGLARVARKGSPDSQASDIVGAYIARFNSPTFP